MESLNNIESFNNNLLSDLSSLKNKPENTEQYSVNFYKLIDKLFDTHTTKCIKTILSDKEFLKPSYLPILTQVVNHIKTNPQSKTFFIEYIKWINIQTLKKALASYEKLQWKSKPQFIPYYFWYIGYQKNKWAKPYLTIVDYTWYKKNNSNLNRVFVINMNSWQVEIQSPCGIGKNSLPNGASKPKFSNIPWSLQSSLWFFKTPQEPKLNKNKTWKWLFIKWLEKWINDNANTNNRETNRWIAVHPVSNIYSSKTWEQTSEWCITIPWWSEWIAKEIIETIKWDSLIFSYFPDPQYFRKSKIV